MHSNVQCKWMGCQTHLEDRSSLASHVLETHIAEIRPQDMYVCLWEGCKVFNKPSRSRTWLTKHMNSHTGDKPFKCVIGGCKLSFSSQEGLARHVQSHFKEVKQKHCRGESPGKKQACSVRLRKKRLKCAKFLRRPPNGK